MNNYLNRIFLVYIVLIFLLITPFSYSTNLNLDLIEGGCVGYDNALLELYYDNESMVDSSSFEVTVYDGPIRGLGVLDSFTADQTPYNIMFNEGTDYLYTISTNNDTLYTGLEGRISIYECGGSGGDNANNLNDEEDLFENSFQYNSLFSIRYFSNSIDEVDFTVESIESIENELETNNENNEEVEYYRINHDGSRNIENISIQSDLDIYQLDTSGGNWIELDTTTTNVSFPLSLAVKTILQNESNRSSDEDLNTSEDSSANDTNSQANSNNGENPDSNYPFENNNENNMMTYLIVGGGILCIIIIVLVVKSISKSKKNKKAVDEAPLTLTQTKIMTYCDNYKHRYEPKEIVEQLVEQGYDRQVVIDTLWKYVEKEKKQNK